MALSNATTAAEIANLLGLPADAPRRHALVKSAIDGLYLLAPGLIAENITHYYPGIDAPLARILIGLRPSAPVAPAAGDAGGQALVEAINGLRDALIERFEHLEVCVQELKPNETLSISRIGDDDWDHLKSSYGLEVQVATVTIRRTLANPIPAFNWNGQTEVQAMGRCMVYMQTHFSILGGNNVYFHNVSGKKQFLSTHLPHGFNLKGTADIAVSSSNSTNVSVMKDKLLMILELKLNTVGHDNQANTQLLAANHISKHQGPVLHILTNLGNQWTFRWLSPPNQVMMYETDSPTNAHIIMDMSQLKKARTHTGATVVGEVNPFFNKTLQQQPRVLSDLLEDDIARIEDLFPFFSDSHESKQLMVESMMRLEHQASGHHTAMYS